MGENSYWVEAARPRTLVAGIVPVLVGTAAAGRLSPPRFLGSLVVAVFMQVGVNFANDYFDAVKGVDTAERLGPRRLTSSGLIAPEAMRNAMAASFVVAVAAGVGLAAAAGWELIVVGAVSIVAALGYSGGPFPYGSRGLGEVFVFIFFGVVATVGSAYVQIEEDLCPGLLLPRPQSAFWPQPILVANNLRDIPTDSRTSKRTLAVILGDARTRVAFKMLILGSYLSLGLIALCGGGVWVLLPLLSFPLAIPVLRKVSTDSGRELIGVLVGTARLQLAFGVLLAVGSGCERHPLRTHRRALGISWRYFDIPLKVPFRGQNHRQGAVILGPCGWGECSPFPGFGEGDRDVAVKAAYESAFEPWPEPVRDSIPVHVTIPALGPEEAAAMVKRVRVHCGEGEGRRGRRRGAARGGAGGTRAGAAGWWSTPTAPGGWTRRSVRSGPLQVLLDLVEQPVRASWRWPRFEGRWKLRSPPTSLPTPRSRFAGWSSWGRPTCW